MDTDVFSLKGDAKKKVELPRVFGEEVRPDVIRRSVLSAQSSRIQPKGSDQRAGMETTAETPPKGSGSTRIRRIQGRGYHAAGRGAWAPNTAGGRVAHPPKSEEKEGESLNRKERIFSIKSAISATHDKNRILSRGHEAEEIENLPLVVEDEFETIDKTKEVKEVLENIGVWPDVERVKKGRNIRSGRGKSRGRKYREKVGPLLIVGEDRGIFRGSRNIPGVEAALVDELNSELLAPGGDPARLTIWTESAIEQLSRRFQN